ncbi:hypothetical protein VTK26DRAFT_8482 [Humicola hyalothermophila]
MEANSNTQGAGVAQAQQPTAGLDDNALFAQFDSYPWTQDRSFLQGLMATLGASYMTSKDGFKRQKAMSTSLQARIWWYKSRFNTDIDRLAYETYTLSHGATRPDLAILIKLEGISERMGLAPAPDKPEDAPYIPEWQKNAPKVDLSKKADDGRTHNNANGGAPYPDNFQAIVEAVTMGKPIPGIKEIPNIVVRPPGVTPFGKMKAPLKPWEKHLPPEVLAQKSVFGDVIDKEFPPLPADSNNEGANTGADKGTDNSAANSG